MVGAIRNRGALLVGLRHKSDNAIEWLTAIVIVMVVAITAFAASSTSEAEYDQRESIDDVQGDPT